MTDQPYELPEQVREQAPLCSQSWDEIGNTSTDPRIALGHVFGILFALERDITRLKAKIAQIES